uniref:Regulator of rDNA transcription 14 n=1 Tax=Caenorhabditis tropicalis TaxID=1561998 RepID=A0A1I7TU96_9PELO
MCGLTVFQKRLLERLHGRAEKRRNRSMKKRISKKPSLQEIPENEEIHFDRKRVSNSVEEVVVKEKKIRLERDLKTHQINQISEREDSGRRNPVLSVEVSGRVNPIDRFYSDDYEIPVTPPLLNYKEDSSDDQFKDDEE